MVGIKFDAKIRRASPLHISEGILLDPVDASRLAKRVMEGEQAVLSRDHDQLVLECAFSWLSCLQYAGSHGLEADRHEVAGRGWLTAVSSRYTRRLLQSRR